ncbi:MAG: universal stress protein [Polyangiaceae bacterium]
MVPTDFSPPASRALDRALRLPLSDDAIVTLYHVIPLGIPVKFENAMWAEARKTLTIQAMTAETALRNIHGVPIRVISEVARGKPSVEILERARQDESEIIVLGRHGRRGIRELFLGSTAERIVRIGSVPALVVLAPTATPYKTPLATIDGSEESDSALDLMMRVLTAPIGTIDAIHAYEIPFENILTKAGVSLLELAQNKAETRKMGWNLIQNAVAEHRRAARFNTILRVGDPRRVIIEEVASEKQKHDLVALGRRGRTQLPHLLLGGVAEAILRAAPTDMLFGPLDRSNFSLL